MVEIWKEASRIINEAVFEEEKAKLTILNIKTIKKLKKLGINKIILTSLGNSIASGYSQNRLIKPLLDRNETLTEIANSKNIKIEKYSMARAQNNNDNRIFNWILENTKFTEIQDMNLCDYSNSVRCSMNSKGDVELNDVLTKEGIADIIKKVDHNLANIVVYHGCTGSFLDNVTRKGRHLFKGIQKDHESLSGIINYIQNQNRTMGTNTQLYLGGAPKFAFGISNIINYNIKKKAKLYPNTSYINPIYCKFFYDTGIDFHYDEEEYIRLNQNIMKTINKNYAFNMALIDIDRTLYQVSSQVEFSEITDTSLVYEKIEYWLDYLKENNYDINKFKKRLIYYIKENYPYDFYYIDRKETLDKIKSYK